MSAGPERAPAGHGVDPDQMRFLELHEARCHALAAGREVRDLGDSVLLYDPRDLEPFWNRIAAVRFPVGERAFVRRLDELITLFGTLERRPHVWAAPAYNTPRDLGRRLEAHGFVDLGGGFLMVVTDSSLATEARARPNGPALALERFQGVANALDRARAGRDLALVLAESFDLPVERRVSLAAETAAALETPTVCAYLARVDGEPAAAAKRTTFDGASYLSSIGTRPRFRGQGLATHVTAAAVRDALEAGSRWTYLGVRGENRAARHVYEGLGFSIVGDASGDYLLP